MSVLQRLLLVAACIAVTGPASAANQISTKLPNETRISPLVILDANNEGSCALPSPDGRRRTPYFPDLRQRCSILAQALFASLITRGFDARMESFTPDAPIGYKEYYAAFDEWKRGVIEKYPDRYVLTYHGLVDERKQSYLVMNLSGPGDGERPLLGTIQLSKDQMWTVTKLGDMNFIGPTPLPRLIELLSNTLEERCPTRGFMRNCYGRGWLMDKSPR